MNIEKENQRIINELAQKHANVIEPPIFIHQRQNETLMAAVRLNKKIDQQHKYQVKRQWVKTRMYCRTVYMGDLKRFIDGLESPC